MSRTGSRMEESLRRGHPVAIEPELWISDLENLSYNVMSWGYFNADSPAFVYDTVPNVAAYKALTGGRHLTHICERWATDRTDGLQYAFFNGMGYETWENVWGIWNQLTDRDAAAVKQVSAILHRYDG